MEIQTDTFLLNCFDVPFLVNWLFSLFCFRPVKTLYFFSFFSLRYPFPDLTVITNRRWKIYVPPYQSHLQNLSFHLKRKIKLPAFKGCRDNLLYVNWSTASSISILLCQTFLRSITAPHDQMDFFGKTISQIMVVLPFPSEIPLISNCWYVKLISRHKARPLPHLP